MSITVKDAAGATQTINTINPNGLTTAANSQPVVIASDQTAIPVSATALPLPTGASSATNQTAGNTSLATIATNTASIATAANQTTANTSLATIATNTTGVSTAALQTTGNASLATIATAVGTAATAANQTTANSSLATIATNTSSIATSANQTTANTSLATIATNTTSIATAANQTSILARLPATNGDGGLPTHISNSVAAGGNVQLSSMYYPNSTGNNTTAQLASNASFTGAVETVLSLQGAQVMVVCDTAYTYTINSFIDAAGLIQCGSFTIYRAAGETLDRNFQLPGNYFQSVLKNVGASTTTTLNAAVTFGIMNSTDDNGNALVSEPAIFGAVAMNVATSYKAGRQFCVNCTVAGNVSVTFVDGSIFVIPVTVGLTMLPWAVSAVNTSGTTATATYANLK